MEWNIVILNVKTTYHLKFKSNQMGSEPGRQQKSDSPNQGKFCDLSRVMSR